MEHTLSSKIEALRSWLDAAGSVLVAYSGGADSSFLLKVACEVLGDKVTAATATSEIYPSRETEEATRIAALLGARHVLVNTKELENAEFVENSPLRCYHCKRDLFARLWQEAKRHNADQIIDGINCDDASDFRPGIRAAVEMNIRSPLRITGFTKADIREASRAMGLPTWDKPAHPCLSTRFPYGMKLTTAGLARVENVEEFLLSLGLRQVRLRDHGAVARLEVASEDRSLLLDPTISDAVISALKQAGYRYVTLDLEGYRQGSMNEVLRKDPTGRRAE